MGNRRDDKPEKPCYTGTIKSERKRKPHGFPLFFIRRIYETLAFGGIFAHVGEGDGAAGQPDAAKENRSLQQENGVLRSYIRGLEKGLRKGGKG